MDVTDLGIEPGSPALQADSLPTKLSMFYFELILLIVRGKIYLLCMDICLIQYPMLKRLSFPHGITLASLLKNHLLIEP